MSHRRAATNDGRVRLWFNATITAGAVTGGNAIADPDLWVSGATPNENVGGQLMANVFEYRVTDSNAMLTGNSDPRRHLRRDRLPVVLPTRSTRALLSLP
jgi:hypothetical protein